MTLKTMNEINITSNGCNCQELNKKEAIKWIKEIERHKTWEEIEYQWATELMVTNGDKKTKEYMIVWIKHFFNITEKDLR